MTQSRDDNALLDELRKLAEKDSNLMETLKPIDEAIAAEESVDSAEPRLKIPYVNTTPVAEAKWS
jgi:hypothetical protein